jgi:hypothetical protein
MRLSDNEFAMLVEMEEFNSYFQRLSPDELVLELLRFESPTSRIPSFSDEAEGLRESRILA